MTLIEKMAIEEARRVMNQDEDDDERIYVAGYIRGFEAARELIEKRMVEAYPWPNRKGLWCQLIISAIGEEDAPVDK